VCYRTSSTRVSRFCHSPHVEQAHQMSFACQILVCLIMFSMPFLMCLMVRIAFSRHNSGSFKNRTNSDSEQYICYPHQLRSKIFYCQGVFCDCLCFCNPYDVFCDVYDVF